jgi:ABC-type transport system involved in cytochrome bd biosynthesis fused ATPase/permease subunit
MKARLFEQNGITVQSQSWKRKLAHSAERILSGMSMGRVYSPRFLPLLYLVICIPTVLFLIFFSAAAWQPR